jgi:mono/diheme cytochrome c family protein
MKTLLAALLTAATLGAATLPMDSVRGDVLFQLQGCVQCHSLKGVGGQSAPDLGRVLDRAYTPALLAGTMWNHAPVMWTAIRTKGLKVGDLDQQASADLFASFYSARYFEMAGDAGRGRRLFASKSCERCHGLTASPNPSAKPVNQWQSLNDPIALVGAMWNHSPAMWSELSSRKISWPTMTAQDLTDLQVYLRNSVPARPGAAVFSITAGAEGEKIFADKGCGKCHSAAEAPNAGMSLTGVAAAMWNHAPLLKNEPPRLSSEEMREVLSVYWARQFFRGTGDAGQGKRVFAAKRCVQCHAGAGPGPDLAAKAGTYNGMSMVSALWRHGPAMLEQMDQKKIKWPVFRAGEMADVIAWLNQGSKK